LFFLNLALSLGVLFPFVYTKDMLEDSKYSMQMLDSVNVL